jgi:hypothetical protein
MMESKALTVPAIGDATALNKSAGDLLVQATGLVIRSNDDLEIAGMWLRDAVTLKAKATELVKDSKAGAHKLHKDICAMEMKLQEVPLRIEAVLRPKVTLYRAEQAAISARKAEEERKKAQDLEEERRLAQAQAMEAAGQPEVAEAIIDAPMPPPAPVAPATPKLEGVVTKKTLKFRVVNPDAVGRDYCEPSEKKIRDMVSAVGMKAAQMVGGIEVFEVESLAVKAWK